MSSICSSDKIIEFLIQGHQEFIFFMILYSLQPLKHYTGKKPTKDNRSYLNIQPFYMLAHSIYLYIRLPDSLVLTISNLPLNYLLFLTLVQSSYSVILHSHPYNP